ncbi:hypothetical protein MMC15_001523 [Xylographa vitiligo]|nr:hypothetical protein [Xylographa vitiligo]
MSSSTRPTHGPAPEAPSASKSAFEQQRTVLVGEIATVGPILRLPDLRGRKLADVSCERAQALENVLQNMNKLNRSLEGIIAVSVLSKSVHTLRDGGLNDGGRQVGDEFGSVEALWSQFEGVMAREGEGGEGLEEREEEAEEGDGKEEDQTMRLDGKV